MINIQLSVGMPLISCIVVWLSLCKFGYFLDDKIDANIKKQTYQLLDKASRTNWPEVFISLFDRMFSSGDSGRPAFWRSALASCIAFSAVTVIFVINRISINGEIFGDVGISWSLLVLLFPYVVAVNVVGDHFSLWQTRFVLGLMIERRSSRSRLFLLVLDAVASALIYFFSVIAGSALFLGILVLAGGQMSFFEEGSWMYHFLSLTGEVFSELLQNGGLTFSNPDNFGNFFGILLYTTLVTSVWIWAFLVGIIILPIFFRLWNVFKVKENPVGAAMCTGGVAIGLLTFMLLFVNI